MKKIFLYSIALAFVVSPVLAADDSKKEAAKETTTSEANDSKAGSAMKKAVGVKAVDKVGNDGIGEKAAKAKVLTK